MTAPEEFTSGFTHNPTELPERPSKGQVLLTVRPRRISVYGGIAAGICLTVTIIVGLSLRTAQAGIEFTAYDQYAVIFVGLLAAAGIMLVARPRLRVTEQGLWVRNVLGERFYQWEIVYRIAFPEGANWAQLALPDDEVYPVMAIQAMDRGRAVTALKAVRELHGRYAPPAPELPAEVVAERTAELLARENARPLGRLEKIDRIKAAQGSSSRGRR